ncbi:MAG: nucleoside hydrolase, partial [Lachnospiraceae bacterium]|nr:nucleoside hydrolase [Lachnospiraceae bacterium]
MAWNYKYVVPDNKKVRVIVHTDCKNEADDQFALAHHLMTPKFDVRGIVAGHFWKNPQIYGEEGTAKASYDEIIKVLDLMGLAGKYPVLMGAAAGMGDEETP